VFVNERFARVLVRRAAIATLSALAIATGGCYPDSSLTIAERDLVVTFYDTNRNFANYVTFAMPESILHVADSTLIEEEGTPSRVYDKQILSDIKRNLRAMGWTYDSLGTSTGGPDVALLVSASTTTWLGWTVVPCATCWGYWPGWGYYPGYPGYGGGYYPPYTTVPYEFDTGSVLVDMLVPGEAGPGSMISPVIWSMAFNGIVESSASSNAARITDLINQGFSQSQYLGEGK
jgi:hypothetical protein